MFSRRHYRAVSPPSDTPEQIRERAAFQLAREHAISEREHKFPEITPANAVEVLRYQEERIAFHVKRLCGPKP